MKSNSSTLFYKHMVGFTLLELIIAIAIIGIIAAIAIPSYANYAKRAYFTEIVNATTPYRVSVIECIQHNGNDMRGCNSGENGIPKSIEETTGLISSLIVKDGIIAVTPGTSHGLTSADTYILTPVINSHSIAWQTTGGAVTNGLVRAQS